jgi:hypothetical protein
MRPEAVQIKNITSPVVGKGDCDISSSDVNLDLNGNTIDCWWGIWIEPAAHVSHISIKNGTFNVTKESVFGRAVYCGIEIFNADHVSVENVNFNGAFGFNADWGYNDSIKNCGFESPLAIDTAGAGHNTYENLTASDNQYGDTGGYPNGNDPNSKTCFV